MMATIRVLIADDASIMRTGLRLLLSNESDIALVGEATTGEEAQALAVELRPDVLLLDLSMPGLSVAGAVQFLSEHALATRVVVLAAYPNDVAVRELVNLGVGGYVLRDDEPEAVMAAVAQVGKGGTWFSPKILASLTRDQGKVAAGRKIPDLTGRQKELLALVKKGWDNQRIAAELNLQTQTVRNYLTALYGKIDVTSRAEAVVWAHEHDVEGE